MTGRILTFGSRPDAPGGRLAERTGYLLMLAVAVTVLTACGGSTHPASTTAATGPAMRTAGAFFLRQAALTRVPAQIPLTSQIATSTLNKLLAGPPPGYDTEIPAGTSLGSVAIVHGTATASFSAALGHPTRSAQGQIVLTLMQLGTVRRVAIVVAGIGQVPLQDGTGRDLGRAATASDYLDLTADAPIFVRTPARDSTVSSPVHVAGTADTFEATFQLEIRDGRKSLRTQTITATSGSGSRGTWAVTLDLPRGEVTLVFYEVSQENGSHLHTTEVPLHVR